MADVELITRSDIDGADISSQPVIVEKINAAIAKANAAAGAASLEDAELRGDVDFLMLDTTMYGQMFVITDLIGAGTNVCDSYAVLTTGALAGDRVRTFSRRAFARGDYIRGSFQFEDGWEAEGRFGFYLSETRHFLVTYDDSVDNHLRVSLADNGAPVLLDLGYELGPAETVDLQLWTDDDGTPHVAINGTELDISALTGKMDVFGKRAMWEVTAEQNHSVELRAQYFKYRAAISV